MWSWNQCVLIVSLQSPRILMDPFSQALRPGLRSLTKRVSLGLQGNAARGSVAVVLMVS
jgi:hypothetical protein